MKAKLERLFQELDELRQSDLSDIDDQSRFLELTGLISDAQEPEATSRLLDYVEDNFKGEDVEYLLEELPDGILFGSTPEVLIPAFLKKLPSVFKKAPEMCAEIFLGIFDKDFDKNSNSQKIFKEHLHLCDRAALKALLDEIGTRKRTRHEVILLDLKKQLEPPS